MLELQQTSLSLSRKQADSLPLNRGLIRHALIAGLLMLSCLPALSAELQDGEAIVVFRARDYAGPNYGISRFVFREVGSNKWFKIENKGHAFFDRDVPKRVSAGEYYLEKVYFNHPYSNSIAFPQPETAFGLISLEPGAVNYIGEWHLHRSRYGQSPASTAVTLGGVGELRRKGIRDARDGVYREVTFSAASLRKFREEHPELTGLPLRIAKGTGKVYQGDWSNLGEHTEVERKDGAKDSVK